MNRRRLLISAVAVLACIVFVPRIDAAFIIGGGPTPATHTTDGQFDPGEWNSGTNANKSFFPVVGDTGGAWLYVAQGSVPGQFGNLYLMYDWTNSPALGFDPTKVNTFFDVFFQVKDNDYVAQFGTKVDSSASSGFDQVPLSLFEKLHSVVSPVNPDGSLNLSSPPWTLLNPAGGPDDPDFTNGKLQSAIGYGSSPNSSANHLLGELQMTIDTNAFPGGSGVNNGLYDPSPAFWSGSGFGPAGDPPFTSGIFILNPDGSTTVDPVFGPNGGPALQPQDVAPEPSSLVLCGMAGLSLAGYVRRRKKAA